MKRQSSMLALLCDQSDRVWSLRGMVFEDLGGRDAGHDDELASLAETLAMLLFVHMEFGTKVQLRLGEGLLMARVEATGILMAWRQQGGNAMLIGSFLDQCCKSTAPQQAGEPESLRFLPEIPDVPHTESLDAETAVHEEPAPQEVALPAASEAREFSVEDVGGHYYPTPLTTDAPIEDPPRLEAVWERDRRTAQVISLPDRGDRRIESVSLGADESDPISFEVEYDTLYEDPTAGSPGALEDPPSSVPPAPREALTRWLDFEGIVQSISDLAERLIGQRVANNYWRRALEPSEQDLAGLVDFRRDRGLVFVEPTMVILKQEAFHLLAVIDRWLDYCERVVPGEAQVWRRMVGEELNTIWSNGEEIL